MDAAPREIVALETLPAPLVPANVDLRGLGYVLRVDRLLASELVALCSPEEGWAAFMLWCRAWQQVPAASLPNNESILASFSMAGRRWQKVRAMALRGFVLCSDQRLYHRVLADEALEAWQRRLTFRERSEKANKAKRLQQADLEADLVGFLEGHEGKERGREGEGEGNYSETPVSGAKPAVPPCQHEQIVDLYNEILPMGRQIRKSLWNGTRAKHLQARWREDPERQNLLWWGKLFHHIAKSPFLTGKTSPRPGRNPFEISLDWIVDPGNFPKILEGKYDA